MDAGTTTPRWLDARAQCAWRSFLEMQGALNARRARQLQEESALSMPDFAVLVQLTDRADGRARVLELAAALRWEKSRLSHHLARMQQRGLVAREECSADRRGAFMVVTEDGRAAIEAAAPMHVAAVRRYLFDVLDRDQIDALATISATVLKRLADDEARESA
jgi:DNA-binding MarR family transcriptional regulator